MHKGKRFPVFATLLSVVVLLSFAVGAAAQWTVNNVPRSWDDNQERWENGNIIMWLNNDPQPFYYDYGLRQGQDEFNTTPYANACVGGGSTAFAGQAIFALDHTDTDESAPGFQSTDNWALVRCSALDGDPEKKYPAPADVIYTCTPDNADGDIDRCEIVTQDFVDATQCDGNCFDEIITTVRVNLDTDCDGNLDAGFDDDVCLYWEAEKPPNVAPYWQGNLQVHVDDGGGRKTINFGGLLGPNAVGLQSFAASTTTAGVNPLGFLIGAAVIGFIGLFLAWRSARG